MQLADETSSKESDEKVLQVADVGV